MNLKQSCFYIIFKNKLQASLPCIDVISFDNLKVCKLDYNQQKLIIDYPLIINKTIWMTFSIY